MVSNIPSEIVEPLLGWFSKNARTLPWRSDPTPYHVWVSEIMLQQTRVEACIPYYTRFMGTLPDIYALANAEEQLLLKLWEGLGYYNRVRNLQKAAKIIIEQYGGVLPNDPALLIKLPGIGPYTAGAIASISYGVKTPAVDGNVLRVLSRLTACDRDITEAVVKSKTQQALQNILPTAVGKFNQSLMEIGALVCIPNGVPLCKVCPLYMHCKAAKAGNPTDYPVKAAKRPRKAEDYAVLLLMHNGKIAIRQRPAKGLLGSLWEYPSIAGTPDETDIQSRLLEMGISVSEVQNVGTAKHIFTHIEWSMTGYLAECLSDCFPVDWVWVTPTELHTAYPIPSAFRAFTNLL